MPLTTQQHEKALHDPAVCELLPVRDYLDNIVVRTNGAFVAGYELRGVTSYFATDGGRNQTKTMLDALLRSIPEQSMRVQLRYEVTEDVGDLLERYLALGGNTDDAVTVLDAARVEAWHRREREGQYRRRIVHLYLIWDPRIHRRLIGKPLAEPGVGRSLSAKNSIVRTSKLHNELLAEFESLLPGIESMLEAANLGARRLTDVELFLETKRALAPLDPDSVPLRRPEEWIHYRSARQQLANVSILDETESYLNIGGILYSVVSLKELPDATFPGLLRDLLTLDFPIVINAQIVVPDQTKVLKSYKSRLRKMQAAQRDANGGFRPNVEAQVSEAQLLSVQQDIIASSLKTVRLSLSVVTRTSTPAMTLKDLEEAERTISNRRQQLLSAVARMNGAKGVPETLAKRRLFFSSLPAMGEEDRREQEMLSTNAADLLPVEMPWLGTPRSPLLLFETPYGQLIPFSPFDPSLSDANVLTFGKTGSGKTLLTLLTLSMSARVNPLVSIIERGDSYQPLVELMGGQMITMSLDSEQTLNPWDLPAGERTPSKDQVSFLKNLTRHMLGEGGPEDTDLLDNLITEAILRVYKRAAIRASNPIPTFSDLRDELSQWRDEEKSQRVVDEAHLAAIKLRIWTGEKGVYSRLLDRATTASLDSSWLYFNIEQLSDDARLQAGMSLVIAHAMSRRTSGKTGRLGLLILDEFWALLRSRVLAQEAEQEFRTARKRGVGIFAISQSPEDVVGTEDNPHIHGAAIMKNCSTKIIGQQPGDVTVLREHLHLNETALNAVKRFSSPRKGKGADALIAIGEKAETTHTIRMTPTPLEYWIMTTYKRERTYRKWWLSSHPELALIESYEALAKKFPFGLADLDPLPEEISGAVLEVTK